MTKLYQSLEERIGKFTTDFVVDSTETEETVKDDEEEGSLVFAGHVGHGEHHRHHPVHSSIDESSPLLLNKPLLPPSQTTTTTTSVGAAWKWYENRLEQSPVLTKSITAAILVGLGDLAGQSIELYSTANHNNYSDQMADVSLKLNVYRTSCFAMMGLLLQGPLTHYYYVLLDGQFPPTPQPWTMTTFIKLAIDQLIWAPAFTVCVFVFLDALQHQSPWAHLREAFWTTLVANWKLWVPASLINMAFCPPPLRVLYCNVIFFIWSICLSLLLN